MSRTRTRWRLGLTATAFLVAAGLVPAARPRRGHHRLRDHRRPDRQGREDRRHDVRRLLRGHQPGRGRRSVRRTRAEPVLRVLHRRQRLVHAAHLLDGQPAPRRSWTTTAAERPQPQLPLPGRRFVRHQLRLQHRHPGRGGQGLRLLGVGPRGAADGRSPSPSRTPTAHSPGPPGGRARRLGQVHGHASPRPAPAPPAGSPWPPAAPRARHDVALPARHLQAAERPAQGPRREDRRPGPGLRALPRRLPGQHRLHAGLQRGLRLAAQALVPVEGHHRPGRAARRPTPTSGATTRVTASATTSTSASPRTSAPCRCPWCPPW